MQGTKKTTPLIEQGLRGMAKPAVKNRDSKVRPLTMKLRFSFVLAMLLAQLCPAVELRDLKLLYVGNATSTRAADFKAFLCTNVAQVEVTARAGFDPAQASEFDVVLLDWSQSESRGEFPPKKSPLGTRDAWTKPMVLLGSAGLHISILWDVKGGFG
jgi:hypothetical protein